MPINFESEASLLGRARFFLMQKQWSAARGTFGASDKEDLIPARVESDCPDSEVCPVHLLLIQLGRATHQGQCDAKKIDSQCDHVSARELFDRL